MERTTLLQLLAPLDAQVAPLPYTPDNASSLEVWALDIVASAGSQMRA